MNTGMTVVPLNDWEVHATTGATSGSTDAAVDGYVSGPNNGDLRAHVYSTAGGPTGTQCNFEVVGKAKGEFNETTQELTVTETGFSGNLTITNVQGNCLGQVVSEAEADFSGTITIGDDHEDNTKDGGITHLFPINLIPS